MSDQSYIKHDNIFQAINAVMGEVGYVKKQKSLDLKYTYAGEAALIEALRPAMVSHGVFCYATSYDSVTQSEYTTRNGAVMTRTTLRATVRFQHDSGTFIDVQSVGEGADSGDKSLNKAMTGAYKYALRQTFCIETGDDPDKSQNEIGKRETTRNVVSEKPVTESKPEMSIAMAELEKTSDGTLYKDIDTDKLTFMVNAMLKKQKEKGLDPEKLDEYNRKIAAAQTIIASRK
jgi:hypothetical protein